MDALNGRTDTPWRRRLRVHAGQLALAGACVAALPATAIAAPSTTHAKGPRVVERKNNLFVISTVTVKVKKGVLSTGNTVPALTTAAYVKPLTAKHVPVADAAEPKSVNTVVRKGVNARLKRNYSSNGFACTATVVTSKQVVFGCEKQFGKRGAVFIDFVADYR